MTLLASFRGLTFATALWAFLSLVSTGQIHAAAVAAFLAVFALACLRDRLRLHLPAMAWNAISLAACAAAMWGWFHLGQRMYSATYFFFYLELNKLLTGRTNRDFLQVYALTFFHVLAGAVSTESVAFAPMLAVYVLLVVAAMIAFTIKRDAEEAFRAGRTGPKAKAPDPAAPRRLVDGDGAALRTVAAQPFLTGSFAARLSGMSLGVLLLGAAIFWIVPRTAKQSFFSPFGGEDRAPRRSGFADNIEFGGVGEIQTDPSIVMRAQPELGPGAQRPESLRIRGTALEDFTGRSWRKSAEMLVRRSAKPNTDAVEFEPFAIAARQPERKMQFRMTLEPESSGYMFMPDQPGVLTLDRAYPLDVDLASWSARRSDDRYTAVTYNVTAIVAPAQAPEGVAAAPVASGYAGAFAALGEAFARDVAGAVRRPGARADEAARSPVFLAVPPFDGRETVRETAREWTQGLTEPRDIARAIERRFKTEFGYSLENDFSDRADHIAWFLTEARTGHCEYFATAMALMLRELGVPSRVVNGYYTDEWSATGARFIVRQEHAHSWVEALVGDSDEWTTYDPTPDAGIGANRTGASFYHFLSRATDVLKMVWYEAVIDYNQTDQQVGFRTVLRWLRDATRRTQSGMAAFQDFMEDPSDAGSAIAARGGLLAAVGLPLAIVAGVALALFALRSARARRRAEAAAQGRATTRADLHPYLELLRDARATFPRGAAQTPMAWARAAADTPEAGLEDLVPVTAEYYRARYENAPPADGWAARVAALRARVAQAKAGRPEGGA